MVYTLPAPSSATPAAAIPVNNEFVVGAIGVVVLPLLEVALSTTSTDPVTVPPSPTSITEVAGVPVVGVNGTLIVSVADRGPAAEGVAVTATLQSKEKSAFCVPQVAVPSAISGAVASAAVGAAVPAAASGT